MKCLVGFASIAIALFFSLINADRSVEKQQLNQIYQQHKDQQLALHSKHQLEQQKLHKDQQDEQDELQKKQRTELQVFQKQQLLIQQSILQQQQQILNQQQQQLKDQEQELEQQQQQHEPNRNQTQSEQGSGSVSGPGTGAFCRIGKLNMVTYAASCFDTCSTIQMNFALCPNGKVCCSTVDAITKIVLGKLGNN